MLNDKKCLGTVHVHHFISANNVPWERWNLNYTNVEFGIFNPREFAHLMDVVTKIAMSIIMHVKTCLLL